MAQKIINGIVNRINLPNLIDILVNHLTFGELQSLLMKTFELKIGRKKYRDILSEFQSNRFVQPSDIDPVLQRRLELDIFSLLPDDFEIIDLSPLTPAGTCSLLTVIHQNNVVSTIKNLEVAADTTNILTLECAKRRNELLRKNSKSADTVRLCASQRLTRGQPFENKNFSAHFKLMALCTAGRDMGNDLFEIFHLEEHIGFYISILEQNVDAGKIKKINIKFFDYGKYDNSKLIENIRDKFAGSPVIHLRTEKDSEFGNNYYSRLRFMISVVNQHDQEFDYIDGGFTDWTGKLLSNKKERLLTSGIGTDFLIRTIKIKISEKNR